MLAGKTDAGPSDASSASAGGSARPLDGAFIAGGRQRPPTQVIMAMEVEQDAVVGDVAGAPSHSIAARASMPLVCDLVR